MPATCPYFCLALLIWHGGTWIGWRYFMDTSPARLPGGLFLLQYDRIVNSKDRCPINMHSISAFWCKSQETCLAACFFFQRSLVERVQYWGGAEILAMTLPKPSPHHSVFLSTI